MKVLDDEHSRYVLQSYDAGPDQDVVFTRWGKGGRVVHPATIPEEMIRVLIDHIKHKNDKQADEVYQRTLDFLRMSLMGLEIRAAEKTGRRLVTVDFHNIESITVCPICGHIACEHKEQIAKEAISA